MTSDDLLPHGYGRAIVTARPTTADMAAFEARWLGGLSASTRRGYKTDVDDWLGWCASKPVDPRSVTWRDVIAWLDKFAHRRPATRARKLAAVSSFYRWLREEGVTDVDPAVPTSRRPKVTGIDAARLVGLDVVTAQRVMRHADGWSPRMAALVALMFTTGVRVSEARSITPRMLKTDGGGRVLLTVIGKGEKVRSVVVPPYTVERLIAIEPPSPDDPYFVTRTGKPWSSQEIYDSIRRLGRRADVLHLHPHLLRHTAASLALKDGANIRAVQEMLGHANLNTTQRYTTAAGALDSSPAYSLASQIAGDPSTPDEGFAERAFRALADALGNG